MSGPATDRWMELRPYLDRALDLSPAEQSAYIESLRAENPALASELQTLLSSQRAAIEAGFLEDSPASLLGAFVTPGQTLGPYTLITPIGQGGMGTVWLAERTDGRFRRKAAIKFLNAGLLARDAEQRFRREGNLLARLTHPHIAQLMDAGVREGGHPYLVLEHVDGEPINRYCDRKALSVDARLTLFLNVLAAVAHAHANFIVHRDLKPSNVLVTNDGIVKLLDFGVAKLLEDSGTPDGEAMLTRDGAWAMTPEYAAPEQVTGEPVSAATDVYALGVLLYALLSGRHPAGETIRSPAHMVSLIVGREAPEMSAVVTTDDDTESAAAIAGRRSTTPERLKRRLRGDLATIVRKAMRQRPSDRYASVDALAEDLRRSLRHEPITARPVTFGYRAARFVRRHRTAVALAAVAGLAVVAGVIGTLSQARVARSQRDFAVRQLARVEAVNDLNQFLLSNAAPAGRAFTVSELLERAERIVARQHGDEDIRADMLVALGRQYELQEENERALRLLEDAYTRSRSLTDQTTRARTACALAVALAGSSDLPRAQRLIDEGLAELPRGLQYAPDRVSCLLGGSDVARHAGAAVRAVEYVEEARRELQNAPYRSAIQELRVLMELAESYRVADRRTEAIPVFEQAAALLSELGRDETAVAGTLFNNWALTLNVIGRPLDAEPIYRKAIELSRTDDSDEGVSPMLLINYGRALRDLTRLDEAARYAEHGYAKARTAGHEVIINQSLLLRASIYREQDKLIQAAAMLDEVEPRLNEGLPPGHIAFASLASERAQLASASGDLSGALEMVRRAIGLAEAAIRSGREGARFMPVFLVLRSEIERELGELDAAVTDADSAVRLMQDAMPPGMRSSTTGLAYLALGRALLAQGSLDRSRLALRSAVEHLEDAAGVDHPGARSARGALETGAGPP